MTHRIPLLSEVIASMVRQCAPGDKIEVSTEAEKQMVVRALESARKHQITVHRRP